MPEAAFSALPLGGCHPLEVAFTNETPAAQVGTCAWVFGDGGTGSNPAAGFNYNYANPGLYSVTLTVTSPEGCVTTVSHPNYIVVTPAPLATFELFPNPTSVEEPTVIFSATDPNAITWDWTIVGLDSSHTEKEFSFEFPHVLGDTYEVCLHVTDQWGCEDTQCQTIEVKDPLLVFVPNSFTPNGDGVNDWFFANLVGDDPNAFQLYIFDRWGEKVFESTDRSLAWSGTMMNGGGELLPVGVYAWRLITKLEDGGRKEYMGHVTLLK
jgi:gliding motility-associated-like protein